jgi:hypothetical protein
VPPTICDNTTAHINHEDEIIPPNMGLNQQDGNAGSISKVDPSKPLSNSSLNGEIDDSCLQKIHKQAKEIKADEQVVKPE